MTWQAQAITAWTPRLRWRGAWPGVAGSCGEARGWVRGLLPACDARDDIVFVVSELVANAVRHSLSGQPGGTFGLDVGWAPELVRVVVSDAGGPSVPRLVRDADGDSEGGRGLAAVAEVAIAWGVAGDQAGRSVWADIPWEPRIRVTGSEPLV